MTCMSSSESKLTGTSIIHCCTKSFCLSQKYLLSLWDEIRRIGSSKIADLIRIITHWNPLINLTERIEPNQSQSVEALPPSRDCDGGVPGRWWEKGDFSFPTVYHPEICTNRT